MWPNGIIYKDVALAICSTFASLPVDVLDDSLTYLLETNKHVMEGLTELANTSNATYC